jgi:hypothetical protein
MPERPPDRFFLGLILKLRLTFAAPMLVLPKIPLKKICVDSLDVAGG